MAILVTGMARLRRSLNPSHWDGHPSHWNGHPSHWDLSLRAWIAFLGDLYREGPLQDRQEKRSRAYQNLYPAVAINCVGGIRKRPVPKGGFGAHKLSSPQGTLNSEHDQL